MRSKVTTALTVIGAVTVLVLAANTVALATTGKAILAGKINTASKMTTISRTTPGTGLQVKTKSKANAPFAVNGKGRVANLNADTVDGVDSSTLKSTAYVYTKTITVAAQSFVLTVPLPTGRYVVSYAAYLSGANGVDVDCYFEQDPLVGNTLYLAESRFTAGPTPGANGTAFITKASGTVLRFRCTAGALFTTASDEPIQVVATRVDTVAGSGALRTTHR